MTQKEEKNKSTGNNPEMWQKIELADKDVETVTTASLHVFHSEGRLNMLETSKVQKPNWTSRGEN